MGLFRNILDVFSTWTISDKFGLGAGFLYADFAGEKATERELNEMKAGVSQSITQFINESRKFLNQDLIQILHNHLNNIVSCNKYNANVYLSDLQYFLNHKCAYLSSIIEILNQSLASIESLPEDDFDKGVKFNLISKTRETINCSDEYIMPQKLMELFTFYDKNGLIVENKDELFNKFDSLKDKYLK